MISGCETIGNYRIIESIGTGGFSEVFKGINLVNHEHVALKKLERTEVRRKEVAKEVLIHQQLDNQNIIKFIESFDNSKYIYIVQELAHGGELFEQIEPEVGFPEQVVHFYFVQLIRAIAFLHKSGVCHRDLKPENLLLDGFGNLKLADFGLSTVFKRGKSRRTLTTRCGTPAYMSPEISKASDYEGDDADVWSCCIILVILLTGSLPWDNSTSGCMDFVSYIRNNSNTKINSIPDGPRRIIDGTLKLDPSKRWKLTDIIADPWFQQENTLFNFKFMAADPAKLIQLIKENSSTQLSSLSIQLALTQPDQIRSRSRIAGIQDCFSQPHAASSAEIAIDCDESAKYFVRNNFARFLCSGSLKRTVEKMEQVLQNMLVSFRTSSSCGFTLHFQTVDRRKCPLVGIISLQNLDGSVLVVFKKTRGNPLEYARFFKFIVDQFLEFIQF